MTSTLFLLLAAVALAAGYLSRRRVRRTREGRDPVVGDDLLREILDGEGPDGPGDELPLDEDRIRDAEDRFWDEEWDEPEEWRG